MAVPNITQTLTFYDTTGVIDYHKRIYYVPTDADIIAQTGYSAERYVKCLNAICPPPLSAYTDINMSQWNPEDRELVVKGNVDSFRKGSNSVVLTYIIMKRTNTDSPLRPNFKYYGFFIEKAYQDGLNSVRLELIPDLFTNVFYLSNNHIIVLNNFSTYNLFNNTIKNAYIERQHYNRFEKIEDDIYMTNFKIFANSKEVYKYRLQEKTKRLPISIYDMNGYGYFKTLDKQILNTLDSDAKINNFFNRNYSDAMPYAYASINFLHILTKERITTPTVIKCTDDDEDYYLQANYGIDYEVGANIPSAQQHLIIPFFTNNEDLKHFVHYFKNNGITYYANMYTGDLSVSLNLGKFSDGDITNIINRLQEVYGYYIQSIYVTPYSELSKCMFVQQNGSSVDTRFNIEFNASLLVSGINQTSGASASPLGKWLGLGDFTNPTKPLDDFDSRVVNEPMYSFLGFTKPQTEFPQDTITSINNDFLKGILGGLMYYYKTWARKSIDVNESYKETPQILFEYDGLSLYKYRENNKYPYDDYILAPLFVVGSKRALDSSFNINKKVTGVDETFNKYYEPLLETEPYSLYTLSFLDVESPFYMSRLYLDNNLEQNFADNNGVISIDFTVNLTFNQVVNAQYKLGVIPKYVSPFNNEYYRYYDNALIFVTSQGMTVRNNTLYEYAYTEGARMVAQRYLQSLNGAIDIAKYVVNDTPYNIGSGALRGMSGGGAMGAAAGAIEGAGRSLRDISNMAVDYIKDINSMRVMQEADLAGAGAKADNYACVGTDLYYDLNNKDYMLYYNEYRIDEVSYNSIAKMLERYGYRVDIYGKLNVDDRLGWNFIKLYTFDFVEGGLHLSMEQEEAIREVFTKGVTLLHIPEILKDDSEHNVERVIREEPLND